LGVSHIRNGFQSTPYVSFASDTLNENRIEAANTESTK
jgi:hypothetical protein